MPQIAPKDSVSVLFVKESLNRQHFPVFHNFKVTASRDISPMFLLSNSSNLYILGIYEYSWVLHVNFVLFDIQVVYFPFPRPWRQKIFSWFYWKLLMFSSSNLFGLNIFESGNTIQKNFYQRKQIFKTRWGWLFLAYFYIEFPVAFRNMLK